MNERLIALTKLLDEADTLKHHISRARTQEEQSRLRKEPPDHSELKATYTRWADAGKRVLPEELGQRWAAAIIEPMRGVTLLDLLKDEQPPAPTPHAPKLPALMQSVIEKQIDLLALARHRAWPAPSAVPDDLRREIAIHLAHVTRWLSGTGIGKLFKQNGADPEWRIRPRKPDALQSVDEPLSWLEGLHIYAPAEEIAIVRGVLLDVTRFERVPEPERETALSYRAELERLALRETPTGQAAPVPAALLAAALSELEQVKGALRALEERLEALGRNVAG